MAYPGSDVTSRLQMPSSSTRPDPDAAWCRSSAAICLPRPSVAWPVLSGPTLPAPPPPARLPTTPCPDKRGVLSRGPGAFPSRCLCCRCAPRAAWPSPRCTVLPSRSNSSTSSSSTGITYSTRRAQIYYAGSAAAATPSPHTTRPSPHRQPRRAILHPTPAGQSLTGPGARGRGSAAASVAGRVRLLDVAEQLIVALGDGDSDAG